MTLLLFEEFVPAEYRASLINQGTKPTIRKRLGISGLLGSKKSKSWKQAATLNGKPYTIGSVPRGSSAREAEFERLLAGGNRSQTKVLSLNSSAMAQEPKTSLSSMREGTAIMSPSTIASPAQTQAPPPPPPASTAKPSPESRSQSAFTPASLRKPRFRLGRENKSFIPSEYETVDFDTRLASYSDDELNARNSADNNGKGAKTSMKEKRMSKDDAWVDILVSGRNRMPNQDAELRPRAKTNSGARALAIGAQSSAGRSDPDLASIEVQKVLAGVRPMSANLDDEPEALHGYEESGLPDETPRDSMAETDDTERNGYGHGASEELEGDEASEVLKNLPKKRLGYFDLHPERRPQGSLDESRASNASGYEDDTAPDRSLYSDEQPSYEAHRQPDGDIEVPAFVDPSPQKPPRGAAPAQNPSQSKTANLIEMYRERERQGAAPAGTVGTAPLNLKSNNSGSRIPTRSSSLPSSPAENLQKPSAAAPGTAEGTALSVPTTQSASESPDSESFEDEGEMEPVPPFTASELGRASPMRYVHGAPLHNVIEEEEE